MWRSVSNQKEKICSVLANLYHKIKGTDLKNPAGAVRTTAKTLLVGVIPTSCFISSLPSRRLSTALLHENTPGAVGACVCLIASIVFNYLAAVRQLCLSVRQSPERQG